MSWFIYDRMEPMLPISLHVVVLSLIYQFLDFIFKSPSTTVKFELESTKGFFR